MKPIRPQSVHLWSLWIHAPPKTRLDHHDLPHDGDRLIARRVGMQSIWRIPHEGLGNCKRRFRNGPEVVTPLYTVSPCAILEPRTIPPLSTRKPFLPPASSTCVSSRRNRPGSRNILRAHRPRRRQIQRQLGCVSLQLIFTEPAPKAYLLPSPD